MWGCLKRAERKEVCASVRVEAEKQHQEDMRSKRLVAENQLRHLGAGKASPKSRGQTGIQAQAAVTVHRQDFCFLL